MKRFALGILIILGLVTLGIAANARMRAMVSIFPTYYAKEVCTCLFVLKQDEAFCRAYHAQFLPLIALGVDREAMQVRAWAPIATVSARLIDERFGCAVQ